MSSKIFRLQMEVDLLRHRRTAAVTRNDYSGAAAHHMAAAKSALQTSDVATAQKEIVASARNITAAIDEQHAQMGRKMDELQGQMDEIREQARKIMSALNHGIGLKH